MVATPTGLPADRLALCPPAFEPGPDPLGAAAAFLLGHPARERDHDVLHLRSRVQPGFPDADDDTAALPELADDPQRALSPIAGDPVQCPYDQNREPAGPVALAA
jgi:hypothetical protein